MAADFLQQIEAVLDSYKVLRKRTQMDDMSNLPEVDRQTVVSRAIATINRIAGPSSSYTAEVQRVLNTSPRIFQHINQVIGVLSALREDVANGYLQTPIELAHGEVFGDFLEMAQHLLDSGYKDAAAVIAGSALESHLRALAVKANIPLADQKADGTVAPRKADRINSELASVSIYGKLEQKSITAWLDLRNKAAHGHYTEYVKDQVRLLIDGTRDFIGRNPA